ncbi:Tat pathway signal protein [Streptomyces sp. S4.7]|uniref:Tat pathway signal protein n=1 Tax=Streptomyces sp. S4.7 TaxID=2705439 RepID=UPI0013DB0CA9|nr:Tat pathway signal protein [Streptomyces sp. S4.7]
MSSTPNEALIAWMREHEMSSNTLAEAVNQAIGELTGKAGGLEGSQVRSWKSGRVKWPKSASRTALEMITGLSATDLGFVPRGKSPVLEVRTSEDPVHRRAFIAATTGTALSTASSTRLTVGRADMQRLRARLDDLWLFDDQNGGSPELEERSVTLSAYATDLQRTGTATSRIRSRLYALAATFTATAMWAATDSRRLDRAQQHMEKAITLAGLSHDGQVQHQIWRYASTLAGQRGHWADAAAAAEAAMATSAHRIDPLYASLSHARLALALPGLNEHTRARRAITDANEAFARADPDAARPVSMDFYTRGELDGLIGVTHLRLGDSAQAEFHFHRCLAALRPDQHRNRAYYLLHVAFAQLGQKDLDQACSTAAKVIPPPGYTSTGRIPHLLSTFTQHLNKAAPGASATRAWNDRTRTS